MGRLEKELLEADFARAREVAEARSLGWNVYIADFIADQL